MALCASVYDKFPNDESEIFCSFRTTNRKFFVLFFFSSECFLLCGYVYDERSVATTMNEPAVVTSENATDNIQNNVHDRNPLNLNCSTMIFRFLHFVTCIVHCFFPFSRFFAGFRVWICSLNFVFPRKWMRFYDVFLCLWETARRDARQNLFVRHARRLMWERETRLQAVQRHLVQRVVVGRG